MNLALLFLVPVLIPIAGILIWFLAGLNEEYVRYQYVAVPITSCIAGACFFALFMLFRKFPIWLALPAGIAILVLGMFAVYFLIQLALPDNKKLRGKL